MQVIKTKHCTTEVELLFGSKTSLDIPRVDEFPKYFCLFNGNFQFCMGVLVSNPLYWEKKYRRKILNPKGKTILDTTSIDLATLIGWGGSFLWGWERNKKILFNTFCFIKNLQINKKSNNKWWKPLNIKRLLRDNFLIYLEASGPKWVNSI